MLDDQALTTKLKVARVWFQRAQKGEFPINGSFAVKFTELLEECEQHARRLEPDPAGGSLVPSNGAEPIGAPHEPVYVPDEFKARGFLTDMAVRSPGGKVIDLAAQLSQRIGGRR